MRQTICAVVMTTIRPSITTMSTLHIRSSASLTGERIFLSIMGVPPFFPVISKGKKTFPPLAGEETRERLNYSASSA